LTPRFGSCSIVGQFDVLRDRDLDPDCVGAPTASAAGAGSPLHRPRGGDLGQFARQPAHAGEAGGVGVGRAAQLVLR
jgi:hypothetical protein